jgi:hypothetical protein
MILPEEGVDRLGWFVSRRGHENRSNGGPICATMDADSSGILSPFQGQPFCFWGSQG